MFFLLSGLSLGVVVPNCFPSKSSLRFMPGACWCLTLTRRSSLPQNRYIQLQFGTGLQWVFMWAYLPLSQREGFITDVSLPNTWGRVHRSARHTQHNFFFGINTAQCYRSVSCVFTCLCISEGLIFRVCARSLFAFGLSLLLAECVRESRNSGWKWTCPRGCNMSFFNV